MTQGGPAAENAVDGDEQRRSRAGGEVRRTLDRPPGARYADVGGGAQRIGASEHHADRRRGLVAGAAAMLVASLAWGLARGLLDLGAGSGLLILALVAGVAVGWAVNAGTWRVADHPSDSPNRAIAAALAVGVWLVGSLVAWLTSLALIPDAATSLAERVAAQPFLPALLAQFGPGDVLAIILLGGAAWRAAR